MKAQKYNTIAGHGRYFRKAGVRKAATPKVLAAWEETKPYFPPAKPLGKYIKS